MNTNSYQARLRARQQELAGLRATERSEAAARARARSAERWANEEARPDQARRAGRLKLVHGGAGDERSPMGEAS